MNPTLYELRCQVLRLQIEVAKAEAAAARVALKKVHRS